MSVRTVSTGSSVSSSHNNNTLDQVLSVGFARLGIEPQVHTDGLAKISPPRGTPMKTMKPTKPTKRTTQNKPLTDFAHLTELAQQLKAGHDKSSGSFEDLVFDVLYDRRWEGSLKYHGDKNEKNDLKAWFDEFDEFDELLAEGLENIDDDKLIYAALERLEEGGHALEGELNSEEDRLAVYRELIEEKKMAALKRLEDPEGDPATFADRYEFYKELMEEKKKAPPITKVQKKEMILIANKLRDYALKLKEAQIELDMQVAANFNKAQRDRSPHTLEQLGTPKDGTNGLDGVHDALQKASSETAETWIKSGNKMLPDGGTYTEFKNNLISEYVKSSHLLHRQVVNFLSRVTRSRHQFTDEGKKIAEWIVKNVPMDEDEIKEGIKTSKIPVAVEKALISNEKESTWGIILANLYAANSIVKPGWNQKSILEKSNERVEMLKVWGIIEVKGGKKSQFHEHAMYAVDIYNLENEIERTVLASVVKSGQSVGEKS